MDTKTCLQLTDTHCHIQSVGASTGEAITRSMWVKASDTKPDDVLRRARDAGVTKLICVGCDLSDSELAVEFADGHEDCWASIGIHPHETQHYAGDHAKQERFTALAASAKVIAVGECGLDYFYEHSSKDDQTEILRFQIELALARNLPMIFHVREAFGDFWPVLRTTIQTNTRSAACCTALRILRPIWIGRSSTACISV
jgi:Tat protein secretion system quality control protein TatD with DNase activity